MAFADRASRFLGTVRPDQVWAVCDVDRTVVDTTSWYHACMTPGLLLPPELVADFATLNRRTYGSAADLDPASFRVRTLALIARGSTPFGRSAEGFERAGLIVGTELRAYDEPFDFLRQLHRRHGDRLRVLYLTAGYEPFIRGVVERLHQRQRIGAVHRTVVGTSLDFGAGGPVAVRDLCDGPAKAELIRAMLRAGVPVALVADDDHHGLLPFDEVERVGGTAVRVVHEHGAQRNATWARFAEQHDAGGRRHRDVMRGGHPYSLADIDPVLRRYGPMLDDLPVTPNGIGVGEVDRASFGPALESLCARLPPAAAADLRAGLTRLVHDGSDAVLLRGDLFYLDTPPYLFADPRLATQRWAEQVEVARRSLRALEAGAVPRRWSELDRVERWLALCVLDHLRNAVTQGVDALVRASVDTDEDRLTVAGDALAQRVHDAYWGLLLGGRADPDLAADPEWDELVRMVLAHDVSRFPMRELDDPLVIAVSALSLAEQMRDRGFRPAGVVDFVSGGLELGMSLRAILRAVAPDVPDLGVVHMVYSSKHRLGSGTRPIEKTYTKMLCRLAPHQRARLAGWIAADESVLLYDNNVATFATLAATKSVLGRQSGSAVHAAVAAVYYDNMVRHLEGEPNEGLCDGWQEALDYRPVADYVTAFATWRTSAKTRTLDRLYAGTPVQRRVPGAVAAPGPVLLKVCRVQNVTDLDTVLTAGARAIGIHAVSPLEPAYGRAQARHRPVRADTGGPPDLPIARYEADAIRQLTAALPADVLPVLVVEQAHPTRELLRIMDCYGLAPPRTTLQLQCRLDAPTVQRLREELGTALICAVGADQADLGEYAAFLDTVLDPATDRLLLDFSAHQPDLLGRADGAPSRTADATAIAAVLRGNRVPVLVADDCEPGVLAARAQRLARVGVRVAGLDTQNSVEVPKAYQLMRLVVDGDRTVQALIRKSPDLARPWRAAADELVGAVDRRTLEQGVIE